MQNYKVLKVWEKAHLGFLDKSLFEKFFMEIVEIKGMLIALIKKVRS